jgi:hypothetical protein
VTIRLTYGRRQVFRFRCEDITVRGQVVDAAMPLRRATYRLNGGSPTSFYVEAIPDEGVDWVAGYKDSPAELRCREPGEFCIEIPATAPELQTGDSDLMIEVEEADGRIEETSLLFTWDPMPLPLPLDLSDLSRFNHIQEVGQIVNGAFDLDAAQNVIRSRAPVAPDAFIILGSPHGGQEATYTVRFHDLSGAKWLGLSDFFVRLEEGVPARGIKVGWSSAGMAALSPTQEARSFIAWGDHSGRPEEWAIVTNPPARVTIQKGVSYRVRHQIAFAHGVNRVRFRVWPAHQSEPSEWLCEEEDSRVPSHLPRHRQASFGLFQHMGLPIEWSDIRIRAYDPSPDDRPGRDPAGGREPFLRRHRPGAF